MDAGHLIKTESPSPNASCSESGAADATPTLETFPESECDVCHASSFVDSNIIVIHFPI